MSEHYFSYDPNDRFYTHATADAAREGAKAILDGYRDEAREGWADEASGVCWGRICGTVEVTERSAAQPDSGYDFDMEYALVNTEQEAIGLTLEAEIEARQEDVELAHEDREKAQAAAKAEIERLRAAAEGVLRYVTPPRGDLRGMAAIGNLDAALRGEEAEDEMPKPTRDSVETVEHWLQDDRDHRTIHIYIDDDAEDARGRVNVFATLRIDNIIVAQQAWNTVDGAVGAAFSHWQQYQISQGTEDGK